MNAFLGDYWYSREATKGKVLLRFWKKYYGNNVSILVIIRKFNRHWAYAEVLGQNAYTVDASAHLCLIEKET